MVEHRQGYSYSYYFELDHLMVSNYSNLFSDHLDHDHDKSRKMRRQLFMLPLYTIELNLYILSTFVGKNLG